MRPLPKQLDPLCSVFLPWAISVFSGLTNSLIVVLGFVAPISLHAIGAQTAPAHVIIDEIHWGRLTNKKPATIPRQPTNAHDPVQLGSELTVADSLTTALRPDEGFDICSKVLEESPNDTIRQAAERCIAGATEQKKNLAAIAAQLKVIDSSIATGGTGAVGAQQLRSWFPCPKVDHTNGETIGCSPRERRLADFIEDELGAHLSYYSTTATLSRLGSLTTTLLFSVVKIAGLLTLFSLIAFGLWCFIPTKPRSHTWLVRRIVDDDQSTGTAGAIVEALDSRANPLIAPYIRREPDRLTARRRRQLLLAPPMLTQPEGKPGHSTLVWKDYLGLGPLGSAFIEKLPFPQDLATLPHFLTSPAYDEIDVTIGAFKVAGVVSLMRNLRSLRLRRYPTVLAFVSKSTAEGEKGVWSVRLTCE